MTSTTAESLTIDRPTVNGLRALRREIDADPEVGLGLPRTQSRVLARLEHLDLEVTTGRALSSVVAVLRGGARTHDAPAVLLRGDMDALPIVERSGEEFASTNGAMHACGHDLHTAGLVGAAHILHRVRDRLPGDVIFMFQPGEEGHGGAKLMIDEGVLEAAGSPPIAAYGLHMAPDMPAGVFTTRPHAYMAAMAKLDVVVHGRGGHASRPHQTRDPIQVAAGIIEALQVYVTRRFDVFDPVVVTIGEFHAGTAVNVVPDEARFRGGIRCFSESNLDRIQRELPDLISDLAMAHGATADAAITVQMPATVNDPAHAAAFRETAQSLFGGERYVPLPHPRTGSEDFACILERVPGAFGHLGAAPARLAAADRAPLHSAHAVFDDAIVGDSALFLATMALRRLHQGPVGDQSKAVADAASDR